MKRYTDPIPEIDEFISSHVTEDKDHHLDILKEEFDKKHPHVKKQKKHVKVRHNDTREELDLHNCTAMDAEIRISQFIDYALKKNLPSVLIVHGKGLHSEGGIAVLRNLVHKMLTKNFRSVVKSFQHLPDREGGDGVVEVFF